MQKVFSSLFIFLIYIYKYAFSSLFLPACRFSPTCSEYGIKAIRKHGPFKGGLLTLKRIVSCNPWGRHGHDPVP